ncbi:MAG: hypothetical protein H0U45_17330 [Tatlockia sp.]|jgi:hypothetical protein|nr:hypothetical protein [Tatlockia sp.]
MARIDQAIKRLQAANERLSEASGFRNNPSHKVLIARHQRFDSTLSYMHMEMVTNINEVHGIRILNRLGGLSKAAALAAWAQKVKPDGDWDHKPKLLTMLKFDGNEPPTFPIPGDDEHEYNYDIWSNIHYGYVGMAAGFNSLELRTGATVADRQTVPADDLSVRIGIELWEEYGTNLTSEQLHQAILDHKEEYLRIQDETNIVVRPIDNGR